MTNKQAQITINAIKFMLDNAQYSEDVEEALNMAINALTTQSETHDKRTEMHACDCISRQAAIDAVMDTCKKIPTMAIMAKYALLDLKPAQPELARINDCNGCKFIECYDTDFPCANCVRKDKDYYEPEG